MLCTQYPWAFLNAFARARAYLRQSSRWRRLLVDRCREMSSLHSTVVTTHRERMSGMIRSRACHMTSDHTSFCWAYSLWLSHRSHTALEGRNSSNRQHHYQLRLHLSLAYSNLSFTFSALWFEEYRLSVVWIWIQTFLHARYALGQRKGKKIKQHTIIVGDSIRVWYFLFCRKRILGNSLPEFLVAECESFDWLT